MDPAAAYLALGAQALKARASAAVEALRECRLCPRGCGVDRLSDRWSACKTGRHAAVASWFPHFGEEDCLRGWRGSGTIFFAHCNLRCVFCQNYSISQGVKPRPGGGVPPEALASVMLELQERGCHNINLVTPEHVVPQILEALVLAVEGGLRLPLVYNTSAYDSLESLSLLDGVIDIYMPDFKLWSTSLAALYLKAPDYPEAARKAIQEMHRQTGPLLIDDVGLARRGVLLRHLVMPGLLDETRAILEWIARELGPETYVNLMAQYRPMGRVGGKAYPELDRRVSRTEFREALAIAADVGLTRVDRRDSAVFPL